LQEIKARQWVVDSRPFNNPALPRIPAPVQTEAVILVFADVSTMHLKRVSFFTCLRVQRPPGRSGDLDLDSCLDTSAVKRKPPIATT
jgi:hypothetical protein